MHKKKSYLPDSWIGRQVICLIRVPCWSRRSRLLCIVIKTLLVDGLEEQTVRFSSSKYEETVLVSEASYRADIKWQDENDEEAEVPGQQGSQEDHPMLFSQICIALQEEECQEKNDNNHDSQRSTAHGDGPIGRRQEVMVTTECKRDQ